MIRFILLIFLYIPLLARDCSTQMFSVTLNSSLTYSDVIENLADECDLSILIKDKEAKKKLQENIYFMTLKNASLMEFLDTLLVENNIDYELDGNKLKISYIRTKTFRLNYLAGDRTGTSSANINIANSSGGANKGGSNGSKTGVSIKSNDNFKFWSKIQKEINELVNRPEDSYKAPEPIVNPEAGMITVTGTVRQLNRVQNYIDEISSQLKNQVLIDVNILSVTFDDSATTGIDWSQLHNLQNLSLSTTISSETKTIIAEGSLKINNVIKFLKTQGDVKSISNPKVLTLNNQPALISVGNELFYKIQSTTSTIGVSGAGTQGSNEEVNSVFAGILLDITPEISPDGIITLKINPSISDTLDAVERDSTGSRNIPPDLSRKQISSVVTMRDGQRVILGGLISSKRGKKVSKVPLLGDLPLLDNLFKRELEINTVEELVLIITPHIIKKDGDISLEDLGYRKLSYEDE